MEYKKITLVDVYDEAKNFLIGKIPVPATDAEAILEHYLSPPDKSQQPVTLNQTYLSLLVSAQNANMKTSVIGGSIGGVENLGLVLFDFNPTEVVKNYGVNANQVLLDIEEKLQPLGKVRKTSRSIWPKYCETILSAAYFFKQFTSGDEFYNWANHFYADKRSIAALPMILAEEIYGIGYPLACDFLKELGFINYGKPDVHIIEIFEALGLCKEGSSPYEIQKTIVQIAEEKDVSAYNVDKLFWLIGSGKFYDHPEIGNQGSIGRNKETFIALLRAPYSRSLP
jgi:hypothetical protein